MIQAQLAHCVCYRFFLLVRGEKSCLYHKTSKITFKEAFLSQRIHTTQILFKAKAFPAVSKLIRCAALKQVAPSSVSRTPTGRQICVIQASYV